MRGHAACGAGVEEVRWRCSGGLAITRARGRDPAAAHAMAVRGQEQVAGHLTMEVVERYWAALLSQYAALLRFDVRKHVLP